MRVVTPLEFPALHRRHLRWLALAALILALGGLYLTAGGLACGDPGATPTRTASSDGVISTDRELELSPAELGEAAGALWSEAIQRLVETLEARPEPAAVYSRVAQLKEEYVRKMVALGREIASLQVDGRAVALGRITAALEAAAESEWFKRYVALYDEYASGDQEFALLLASFNILTQYADFELLKLQDPEEAARLGIE